MFLIDTREPPPEPKPPELPPREPNWRMWGWIALAGGSFVGSAITTGLTLFIFVCAAMICTCRAATVAIGYGEGLREHRQ